MGTRSGAMALEGCWSVVGNGEPFSPMSSVTSPSLVFPSWGGGWVISELHWDFLQLFYHKIKCFLKERGVFQVTLFFFQFSPNCAVSDKIPFKFVACDFNTSLGSVLEGFPSLLAFIWSFQFIFGREFFVSQFLNFCFSQNSLSWVAWQSSETCNLTRLNDVLSQIFPWCSYFLVSFLTQFVLL